MADKVPFGFIHQILDPEMWKESVGKFLWFVFSKPVEFFMNLPWYIKYSFYLLIIFLTIKMLFWIKKHKDDCYKVKSF